MIIVVADGRLGNELFYLAAADKVRKKNERVIGFRFVSLQASVPQKVLRKTLWVNFSQEVYVRFRISLHLRRLITWHLLSEIVFEDGRLAVSKGLLPITVMKRGFFQSNRLVSSDPVKKILQFGPGSDDPMASTRHRPPVDVEDMKSTCFVHVRRGDYLTFPTEQAPAVLTRAWYIRQMTEVRQLLPTAKFVVFSDDVSWCRKNLGSLPKVRVVDLPAIECLRLMSQCSMGVLSASSLSWWGAKLASENSAGPFIAPLYWYWWGANGWGDVWLGDSDFLDFRPVS